MSDDPAFRVAVQAAKRLVLAGSTCRRARANWTVRGAAVPLCHHAALSSLPAPARGATLFSLELHAARDAYLHAAAQGDRPALNIQVPAAFLPAIAPAPAPRPARTVARRPVCPARSPRPVEQPGRTDAGGCRAGGCLVCGRPAAGGPEAAHGRGRPCPLPALRAPAPRAIGGGAGAGGAARPRGRGSSRRLPFRGAARPRRPFCPRPALPAWRRGTGRRAGRLRSPARPADLWTGRACPISRPRGRPPAAGAAFSSWSPPPPAAGPLQE